MAQLKYWNGSAWVSAVVGARGPDGIQGIQGVQGVQGVQGTTPANVALLNSANAFTVGGHTITAESAAIIPLRITAAVSQSAVNLEILNSGLTSIFRIRAGGQLGVGGLVAGAGLVVNNDLIGAGSIGILVRGATSQTANLQEWQDNSGGILSNITAAGGIETNGGLRFYASSARSAFSTLTNTSGDLSFNYKFTFTGGLQSNAATAATVGAIIRGAASQSANLQEWQQSDSTVLASISASGFLKVGTGTHLTPNGRTIMSLSGTSSGGTVLEINNQNAGTGYAGIFLGTSSQIGQTQIRTNGATGELEFYTNNSGITATASTGWRFSPTSLSGVPLTSRGLANQSANLQEWQTSTPTTVASVSNIGAISAKAVSSIGYSTTNTAGTFVNQWTKIASLPLTSQFQEYTFYLDFTSIGAQATNTPRGRLFVRVKQQGVMGAPPETPVISLYNADAITIADFALILTQNDVSATNYDLYFRDTNSFSALRFNPTILNGSGLTFLENQSFVSTLPQGTFQLVANSPETEVTPLDDLTYRFDGFSTRYQATYQGLPVSVTNPFRYLISINGILQTVQTPEYVWASPLPRDGFFVDNDGFINFSEVPPLSAKFDGRVVAGASSTYRTKNYPFVATDILLGA